MYLNVSDYVQARIESTTIEVDPFPYIVVENVLPPEFYSYLLEYAIDDSCLQTLIEARRVTNYPDGRKFILLETNMPILGKGYRDFWEETAAWFQTSFHKIIIDKFDSYINNRVSDHTNLQSEVLYVRDTQNYALGPHTDAGHKILTCLLYLAVPGQSSQIGTSIYRPKDPDFTCPGGPYHDYQDFNLVKTAPYRPNTMLAFFKTNNSFHGVEPITENITRNLLIYDLHVAK